MKFLCACAMSLLATCAAITGAWSQDFPSKPIRIITSAAGGGGDFDSRILGQGISASLGQPIVVENRTSIIAAEAVSRAPADGYTLLVAGGSVWIFPLLQKAPYDFAKDFYALSLIERAPSVLAVHPSLPVRNAKELIALAKARPGELNYAHAGVGGPSHLGAELFKSMAGVNIVSIAYKGGAPSLNALMSGEVQMYVADPSVVAPQVKSGRLRALAVTSLEPSPLVPGMITVAASGLPGYEAIGYTGIWAPSRTARPILNRLSQEIVRYLAIPEVKEKYLAGGVEALGNTADQAAATINADIQKWTKLIKQTGIKAN